MDPHYRELSDVGGLRLTREEAIQEHLEDLYEKCILCYKYSWEQYGE